MEGWGGPNFSNLELEHQGFIDFLTPFPENFFLHTVFKHEILLKFTYISCIIYDIGTFMIQTNVIISLNKLIYQYTTISHHSIPLKTYFYIGGSFVTVVHS